MPVYKVVVGRSYTLLVAASPGEALDRCGVGGDTVAVAWEADSDDVSHWLGNPHWRPEAEDFAGIREREAHQKPDLIYVVERYRNEGALRAEIRMIAALAAKQDNGVWRVERVLERWGDPGGQITADYYVGVEGFPHVVFDKVVDAIDLFTKHIREELQELYESTHVSFVELRAMNGEVWKTMQMLSGLGREPTPADFGGE